MKEEILKIENLTSGYGKVTVLQGVSLRVNRGEVVAVIGPNGAGKSTLLKTISGLVKPITGQILFNGKRIDQFPPHLIAKEGIAHVPEGGRLFPNMSVWENLLMGGYANRETLKSGILAKVFQIFPVLEERKNQYARTLSGGEKQMLAIGRGLTMDPSFLMLDEPSLGLAPKLVEAIYEELEKLRNSGLTLLLVEQNTTYALDLADRAYVLENGKIVLEGPGKELQENEHIKRHYLGL
jgi:branched-chain amino acid transport system ATP-binding protein